MSAWRLFFALWPEPPVREALARAVNGFPVPRGRARRVPAERLHLTLLYLGEADDRACATALQLGDGLRHPSFELVLDRLGSFSRARVWWLGATVVPAALLELGESLRQAATAAGLGFDAKPLRPHVTLVRDAVGPAPQPATVEAVRWPVRDFVLVNSRHSGSGPAYEVLRRWPLELQEATGAGGAGRQTVGK